MSQFSPQQLLVRLRTLLPAQVRTLCVAFSGGCDSTALLYAVSRVADRDYRVRAVHVDHGLQRDSGRWVEHCAATARTLDVPFDSLTVRVQRRAELGLEAAAREVRYRALREHVAGDEALLTAHHADDQLETILLALARGAGMRGLSGIPELQRFGRGWLVRPLLTHTRAQLHEWLRAVAPASSIDDPSNTDEALDRNYLRQRVIAPLRARWPSAAHSAVRSARHLGEAQALLDELAASDLGSRAPECVSVPMLRGLSSPRRRNALRFWLHSRGVRAPSTRKLAALEHDSLAAAEDRVPCTTWDEVAVYRYRDLLYCERHRCARPCAPVRWSVSERLQLPEDAGELVMKPDVGAGIARERLPDAVEVRYRRGGERVQLPGERHHRTLKNLLHDARILPWWRDRLPLLFVGERLVAIADLWVTDEFAARGQEPSVRVVWNSPPRVRALCPAQVDRHA